MRQKIFVVVLVTMVAGMTIALYLNAAARHRTNVPAELTGTVWPAPKSLDGFMLSDHRGQEFGQRQLEGQWTMVFFGYTSCPDVCPTTMVILRHVIAELEEAQAASAVRVVLVTVDPDRDDAATLAQYVSHFGDEFIGVRGDETQLARLAQQMGAMYIRDEKDDNGNYEIGHSSSVFLVDPEARMHAAFSPPPTPAAIAAKFLAIRRNFDND